MNLRTSAWMLCRPDYFEPFIFAGFVNNKSAIGSLVFNRFVCDAGSLFASDIMIDRLGAYFTHPLLPIETDLLRMRLPLRPCR
jgi:hypothetical protein